MSGKATFSKADWRGSRLKVWKTKPISLFLTAASSFSDISDTSCPFRMYLPVLGVSKQPTIFIRVDLPEPEGPMKATYSPLFTEMVTSFKASITSSPIT